jgi:hypothetical protein
MDRCSRSQRAQVDNGDHSVGGHHSWDRPVDFAAPARSGFRPVRYFFFTLVACDMETGMLRSWTEMYPLKVAFHSFPSIMAVSRAT